MNSVGWLCEKDHSDSAKFEGFRASMPNGEGLSLIRNLGTR